MSYASCDVAVVWVKKFGKGALLAKTNIEAAFRLLLVHPEFLVVGVLLEKGVLC